MSVYPFLDQKPIDYMSIGHLFFGMVTYLISFSIFEPFGYDSVMFHMIAVFIVSIIWEVFENYVIINLKPYQRKDSIQNLTTDIIFNLVGGYFVSFIISDKVLVLLLSIIVLLIFFSVTIISSREGESMFY